MTEAFKATISGDGKVAGTRRTPFLGLLLRSDFPNPQQNTQSATHAADCATVDRQ